MLRFFIPIILGVLLLPTIALATPISWDFSGGNLLQPLKSAWTAQIKGSYFTATSTSLNSTFPRYTGTHGTTTNATSSNLSVSGQVDFDALTSALVLTGASGILAEYAGTSCTNQFVRALSALGASTCASVATADITDDTILEADLDFTDTPADEDILTSEGTGFEWHSGPELCVAITGSSALCDGDDASGVGGTGIATSGPIASTEVIYATGVGTVDSEAAFTYDAATNKLTATYASTTAITNSGSTYLSTSSGRVGIGTTSPLVKLAVQGDARITGDVNVANLTATGTISTFYLSAQAWTIPNSGSIDFYSDQGITALGSFWFDPAYVINIGGLNGDLQFDTNVLTDTRTVTAPDLSGTMALSGASQAVTFGNATTTSLSVSGQVDFDGLTSALVLTGATGILAEYAGTSCTNQFVRSLSALGAATCATVGTADVSGLDISADTNLTAGDALTLNDDDLDFDGGASPGGELGGTWASPTIDDLATLVVTSGTTTNATSTTLSVSGQVDFDTLTSALVLTGASGILAEYAGTSCTNQFVRSLSALGVATCASVATTDITDDTILEADLDLSDTPSDEDILTSEGTGFEWHSGAELCVAITGSSALCDGDDASGTGGTGIATSGPIANTEVIYGTGVGTVDSEAAFTYDAAANRLTATYASSTSWSSLTASSTNLFAGTLSLTTDLSVANGGTGASSLTDHGVLVGSGTSAIDALAVGTNGQLLVGSTGADPVFATLNCADALTCTTGAGTLEIDFDGGASPSGDLGGTWASPSVSDDSHAHTGATISGIDISGDTNLTAGDALTLTDDDLDFDGGASPGGELGGTWASPTIDDLSTLVVTSGTTTNATSSTLSVSGQVDFDGLTSALVLTGATGILAEYAGTSCTNQFVRSLSALGAATCASVANTDITDGTIIEADLDLDNSPDDGDILVYDSTGTNFIWQTCAEITGSAGLCDGDDGGGGTISTSTALANTQMVYATGVATIGSEAGFTYNATTNLLTVPSITATNATSSTLNVSGQVDFDGLTSALILTGAGGILAEYAGSGCTNQVVEDISALGAANCVSINNGYWSGTDLSVANGGTGLSTFGGTNHVLYTTAADTLSSEAAFTYDPGTNTLTAGLLALGGDTIDEFVGFGMAVSSGDLGLLQTGAADDECLKYESTGPTIKWEDCGGGGSSKWTDSGDFTYLTATSDDLALGRNATATAPFWWDVSATTSYIGNGGAGDSVITLGPTGAQWSLGFDDTNDAFVVSSSTALGTSNALSIAKSTLAATFAGALTIAGQLAGVSSIDTTTENTIEAALDTLTSVTSLGTLTGLTATGNLDFGGASFLEIPNGTGPTANDVGELAHDTTDNMLILDDFVVAKATHKIWSVTIASTSPDFIAGALVPVPVELDGYTMTAIRCKVDGGTSKVIAVEDASANSTEDITCATTVTSDDGSITNASATGAEEMYIDFGATSGAVNYVSISVFGTWTRE